VAQNIGIRDSVSEEIVLKTREIPQIVQDFPNKEVHTRRDHESDEFRVEDKDK
jgi:hypothetical protein